MACQRHAIFVLLNNYLIIYCTKRSYGTKTSTAQFWATHKTSRGDETQLSRSRSSPTEHNDGDEM